jgi:hypothetical protein
MSEKEFASLKVSFTSEKDPLTNQPLSLSYESASFEESDLPLFKLAAAQKLKNIPVNDQVAVSLKYQVLCEQTAMVGVVKQKDKSTGEMQSYTIQAGRQAKIEPV